MTCSSCQQSDTIAWAHNGGMGTHQWGDRNESECECAPKPVCLSCDAPLIQQHGFVVLDAVCFGYSNDTLQ